jgi:predicted component of type VI protein secretion system
MNTPKPRSMPLTAAMARFVDVADLIRSRADVDDVLRDLCEDYRMARQILMQVKKEKPKPKEKIIEYSALVDELEDELIMYLLNT